MSPIWECDSRSGVEIKHPSGKEPKSAGTMLKPQVHDASTGTSVTSVTVAANSERILGNIFRHYLYFIQKHPLCLYLGKDQGNPHLHVMGGRSKLGGTEMKPAALRRTIGIKIPSKAHILGFLWHPERTSVPHPPVGPVSLHAD